MPLDIDGAGRSSTLACLPTARGTVAPTRGQVPGGVLLETSTAPFKVITRTFRGLPGPSQRPGPQGPSMGSGAAAAFSGQGLAGPEKVLLLTKMDLTEFRS